MAQPAYYERPVLLDRERHRRRRVKPATGFGFARKTHSVALAAAEFGEAAKEYAIVFTRTAGGPVVPVALLGLRAGENLFVDAQQAWDARYVPAFVRRYPFVLAEMPGQSLAVCVDEAFAGWNIEEGEALFDEQGQETPFLKNALEFLTRYQREHVRTLAFCERLEQDGLLKEMNAQAKLTDGRAFTIDGLMVVDEQKLLALPDAAALSLFRSGELHLVSMHLASLSNLQRLVDRMAERKSTIEPAPQPAS
ncbi:SapC family protein [Ramlibacter sp. USB13]|uniref:SapC family protein n=1 Tax=Ramlibacter cellulosilyticus TaxID=2764187 RepID=A0A923MN88_9BURK|nr:SapC family protein [Ramlibacter cellulosilyticus]MBC5781851.1 SapC family protein [Ramlibacter cellulosilyticus]